MDCLRRKNHKKREHKKPHTVSDHVSPGHSQPSSMAHIPNGSLPRVSSTGLWMETPSVYAVTPSPNYYYPHPHGYGMYGREHTYPMSRAISESRIPQPVPVPSQRFYHSQHMAPLYEVPPSQGMEIYDYPFSVQNGGYRSKLVEARHTPEYYNEMSEFILRPRVERSKSITEDRRPPKHQQRKEISKQAKAFVPENGKIPDATNNKSHRSSWTDEERKILKPFNGSTDGKRATVENVHGILPSRAFSAESILIDKTSIPSKTPHTLQPTARLPQHPSTSTVSATIHSSENISSSATDSMKLLAKNKTDDQKTQPSFSSPVKENNVINIDDNDSQLNLRHYNYEGAIYAVPKRNPNDSDYDNPIVNRIKNMVIEKTRSSTNLSPVTAWKNPYDKRISNSVDTPAASAFNSHAVNKVTKVTTTVTESVEPAGVSERSSSAQHTSNNIDVVDGLFLPDISALEKDYNGNSSFKPSIQNSVVTATKVQELTDLTRPVFEKSKDNISPRWSLDTDSGVDDINKAGKHIATTAFQFLDSYLSDDEGTESLLESPPISPGGLKAGKVY
ncbi:hypothetical protein BsWGS_06580 [Bradybaena similaris]